ncbi:MAG: glycosyltransferase family 2 protein, partial [Planctomycetaceae bacterium]
ASTDNTPQVVAQWQQRFPHIKYIRRPARMGVDPDILESVRQADGEYCWLFSADDVLEPGAIARVRDEMRHPWNAWLTNFTLCDLRLNRIEPHKVVAVTEPRTFDWRRPAERQAFLDLAQTSTAFCSFISGIVVRREAWNSVPEQTEFVGSCWIIAAQLFALAQASPGLVVRYHPGEALLKRGENDSFMSQGLIRRLDLAVSGFRRVAHHYFGPRSPEAKAVSRVLKCETSAWQLLHLRLRLENPAELPAFDALVTRHFCDGTFSDWLWKRFILLPLPILKSLRWALRT